IEATQKQIATVKQRGLRTQAMEDGGELHRDIATTDHQHTLRQLFEVERLVGSNGMLGAGNVRLLRPASGGDQDMPGAIALPIDLNMLATYQTRMPLQELD